jgi:hypothetical protein
MCNAARMPQAAASQLIVSVHAFMLSALLQAAELQQYAAGQKTQQEEVRALSKLRKQHEEARSKAEVGTSALLALFQCNLESTGTIGSTADVRHCCSSWWQPLSIV